MKEKELKRLSRAELLELLLVQAKEIEHLQAKLEKAEKALSDRNLRLMKAGSLAQAVVEINGVMEAAQAAAQQYLDNIVRMEQETKLRCEKMRSDAQKEETIADGDLISEVYALLNDKTQAGNDL